MSEKWVLITGAAAGLGEGLVSEHLRSGWSVIAVGRNAEKMDALKQAMQAQVPNAQIETMVADVTDFDVLSQTVRTAFETHARLERVIANAGIAVVKPVGEMGVDALKDTFNTNVTGACVTLDSAAAEMKKRNISGHIVGISSIAGVRGLRNSGAYSASKSALSTFLGSARLDLKNTGIAVSDIRPGFIDTDINRDMKVRPFVVSRDEGVRQLMAAIDRQASVAYVPGWPWSVVAQGLKYLPDFVIRQIV